MPHNYLYYNCYTVHYQATSRIT